MRDSRWIAAEDRWFVVEQCGRCPLPGYLIVRSRVPASHLGTLPRGAIVALGPLLQRVVQSIQAVLRPARVYVAQFGEEDGDLHFHVFPRTDDLTREYLLAFPEQNGRIHGPLLLDWARERYGDVLPSEEALRVFEGLRADLKESAAQHAAAPDGAAET